ncbi:MAG: hypothetical protein ABSH25_09460 [Syntrophorhabdales bacterium]
MAIQIPIDAKISFRWNLEAGCNRTFHEVAWYCVRSKPEGKAYVDLSSL